jgi:crotonobetainyl-CoA:carnitine CoA-transferase CaiB-like acyl-CoA transferase
LTPGAAGAALPLDGIRVVALEQAVTAPFCTRQLADMGADVIKIERPGGGDFARDYDGALNGVSAYFAWLNRGKRSIVLDVKNANDHRVCAQLIASADVFVHNLAPGAVERLGFGYDELSARHPRLIWCGISGYGPDGPHRDRKAYDMLVQAEAGIIGMTGTEASPAKVGVSIADIGGGLYAYSSILAALLNRDKTGRGDRIDISMFECMTEWMMPPLNVFKGTGRSPQRAGVRHNMVVPYGAYSCADGDVLLAVQTNREWRRLCSMVLDAPALADDPRFVSNELRVANRVSLESLIDVHFSRFTLAQAGALLEAADIPTGAMNDIAAVAAHPQLAARGRWVSVDSPGGEFPALLPPHNLHGAPPRMGAVPALGEHSSDILAELGVVGAGGEMAATRQFLSQEP